MEGWIALGLLTVAVVSAFGTIVSLVLNYRGSEKRLMHEERMQREGFTHERREAVRSMAADAYTKGQQLLSVMNPGTIYELAESLDQLPAEIEQVVSEVEQSLDMMRALGWSEDVRQEATILSHELLMLARATLLASRVFDKFDLMYEDENTERYDSRRMSTWEALERYRKAISE